MAYQEVLGEIPNISFESLPHRQILVHTPTSSFQCAPKDILQALQTHTASLQEPQPSLAAITALTQLVTQLVSPMLAQHQQSNATGQVLHTPQMPEMPNSNKKRQRARSNKTGIHIPARRSVRLISQGGTDQSAMSKAVDRAQGRYNLRSAAKGNLSEEM